MEVSITTASKSDKKSLMRFYKQQSYSAGLLGLDQVYLVKNPQGIIGAVIISALEKDNPQLFLHGLVIKQEYRQQKIATQLIQHALSLHVHQKIICFADKELCHFYQNNGFNITTENELLDPLLFRYLRYKKTNNGLLVFSYGAKSIIYSIC